MILPLILRLDVAGQPVKWIDWQEAANIYDDEEINPYNDAYQNPFAE